MACRAKMRKTVDCEDKDASRSAVTRRLAEAAVVEARILRGESVCRKPRQYEEVGGRRRKKRRAFEVRRCSRLRSKRTRC